MDEDQIKEQLKIDKFCLDDEWVDQPSLFLQYAQLHAHTMAERDKAKENLEFVRASVSNNVRLYPERYGYEKKPAEPAIEALILADKSYKEAINLLNEAVFDCQALLGVLEAFKQRKSSLEYLTQLYLSGYWSEVKGTEPAKKKMNNEQTEQHRKELNRRMNP